MSNLIAIAESRKARHIEQLMERIGYARRTLGSGQGMPVGSMYDPGQAIAKQRQATRQALIEEIERTETEIEQINRLSGDDLVKMFVPEAAIQDQEVIPFEETLARGSYIAQYVKVDRDKFLAGHGAK